MNCLDLIMELSKNKISLKDFDMVSLVPITEISNGREIVTGFNAHFELKLEDDKLVNDW